MKKLVIRQSNSRISHLPSETYVDTILSKNALSDYKMRERGKNTLSILFDEHIDDKHCRYLAGKLGLEIISISSHRCILCFPY